MNKIYFSHVYEKMPREEKGEVVKQSRLIEVFVEDLDRLSDIFLDYDTKYIEDGKIKHYELSDGRVIILLFRNGDKLWTTIRKWTKEKEKYYRSKRGEIFYIRIGE